MSLPRYPAYKASGIGWMEVVPSDWKLVQLGQAATERCDGPFGSGLTSEHYTDEGALVVRLQNIKAGSYHSGEPAYIGLDYFRQDLTRHAVQADDLLIAGLGDERNVVGRACVAPSGLGEALVKADCFRFRLNPQLAIPRFTALQLSAGASFDAGVLAGGTTRSRIPLGAMASRKLALPPLDEQVAITNFLDHEIAKIDGLIAEQERLIALLAEKRQATISHAVTRGMNPQAPMKDSGVPWLGAVPAHWEVQRIKHLVLTIEQGWSPQCESFPVDSPEEWGVLKVGCVNGGVFNAQENKKLPPALEPLPEFTLKRDDLLISRANTRELVGSAAVVREDFDRLMLCDKLYRLRVDGRRVSAEFVAAYLGTPQARSQIEIYATGASSSMLNIGQDVVLDLLIPCPGLAEQVQITDFLASGTPRLNDLLAEATRTIALLKERRSALIAAAVTGQIDVRGLPAA